MDLYQVLPNGGPWAKNGPTPESRRFELEK